MGTLSHCSEANLDFLDATVQAHEKAVASAAGEIEGTKLVIAGATVVQVAYRPLKPRETRASMLHAGRLAVGAIKMQKQLPKCLNDLLAPRGNCGG